MQAVTFRKYGSPDLLRCEQLPMPYVREQDLLVKVYAAAINPIDWRIRAGQLKLISGFKFPKLLGADVAGKVVAVGEKVMSFKVGDSIYAMLSALSGGGYAEYVAVPEQVAALKPSTLSYTQAAAVPLAGMTALQALRDKANLKQGQTVLINGASGGVGTFAVQLAKIFGAEVTAVCSSRNAALVRDLGANHVIDYTREDFTQKTKHFDLIFDVVGNSSFPACYKALRPKGVYISTEPAPLNYVTSFATKLWPGKKAQVILVRASEADLKYLCDVIETGNLKPVLDKTYSLCQASAAHTYSQTKRARGKLVLTIDHS